jgi:thioredoxin-related protein
LVLAGLAHAEEGDVYTPSPRAIDIPKWFTESFLDFREDIREAAAQKKRLLVYFGQDGCPYCKALMKVNFGDPEIVAATRRNFVAIALNLWGDREVTWIDGRKTTEKELARFLKVQYTPTLLFFDEQGRIALRLNGYQPPDKFRVALDYAATAKGRSFTEYLAAQAPSADASRSGAAIDLSRTPRRARPWLVVFERAACRECDELRNDAFTRPEVKELLAVFEVVSLDLAGGRRVVTPAGTAMSERDWARSLGLVYTPTLVFFDAGGKEVFRSEGYLKPFHVASVLDYVASGAYRREPSFQRFIQKRAEAIRAAGGTVDLWK